MRRNANLLSVFVILGLVTASRGYCEEPAKASDTKIHPAAVAAPSGKDAPTVEKNVKAPEPPLVAGKIIETMDSGRYTYMLLEKDGRKGWVAVPGIKVKVGQEIQLNPGVEMGKFTSNSLKRTFDQIVFTSAPGTDEHKLIMPAATDNGDSAKPAGHPAMEKQAVDKKNWAPLSGKVVETMDSGGYTYVCLEKEGKKTWAAVPSMKVKVGEILDLQPGPTMPNFSSKSLNRTFESIIFSSGPVTKK